MLNEDDFKYHIKLVIREYFGLFDNKEEALEEFNGGYNEDFTSLLVDHANSYTDLEQLAREEFEKST